MQATTRRLFLEAQTLSQQMRRALERFNVGVYANGRLLTSFPEGYQPVLGGLHRGQATAYHTCWDYPVEVYPHGAAVWCVSMNPGCSERWVPRQTFEPYWIHPVIVTHEHHRLPQDEWRLVNEPEGVCFLAQNPDIGSVQGATNHYSDGIGEAYIQGGSIYIGRQATRGHHLAFTKRSIPAKSNGICRS